MTRCTVVVVFPTVSFPYYTVTPTVSCPNPDDLLILDYSNKDLITFKYPPSGNLALRGSGQELLLEPPYEIVVYTKTVFFQMKFSVRNAVSMTSTFTNVVGKTVTTQRATRVPVSLCRVLSFIS